MPRAPPSTPVRGGGGGGGGGGDDTTSSEEELDTGSIARVDSSQLLGLAHSRLDGRAHPPAAAAAAAGTSISDRLAALRAAVGDQPSVGQSSSHRSAEDDGPATATAHTSHLPAASQPWLGGEADTSAAATNTSSSHPQGTNPPPTPPGGYHAGVDDELHGAGAGADAQPPRLHSVWSPPEADGRATTAAESGKGPAQLVENIAVVCRVRPAQPLQGGGSGGGRACLQISADHQTVQLLDATEHHPSPSLQGKCHSFKFKTVFPPQTDQARRFFAAVDAPHIDETMIATG
jgi:hypothetical protein